MISIHANLLAGKLSRQGQVKQLTSIIDGSILGSVPQVGSSMILEVINTMGACFSPYSQSDALDFFSRLAEQIELRKDELCSIHLEESGFKSSENKEIIDGIIEFLQDFKLGISESDLSSQWIRHSYRDDSDRVMRLARKPYQCVAAMVPQNASLSMIVICLASALYVGTRIIIRPSTQCGLSACLLAEMIEASNPPRDAVSIINCSASDFLQACYHSPLIDLIHYIGSDNHALRVLTDSYQHGKVPLIDGEGNTMIYIDKDTTLSIDDIAKLVVEGMTRYKGETCTSINGILVAPEHYDSLKQSIVERLGALSLGHPKDTSTDIGPLFSAQQAEGILASLSACKHAVAIVGGQRNGAYLSPTLIEGIELDDKIVQEGLFGPAAWIHPVSRDESWQWLASNRFPLCDAIISHDQAFVREFISRSRAGRLCINQDPSIESMFEPWGAYPPAGLNMMSKWIEKYSQAIQLDGNESQIGEFGMENAV